MTKDKIIEFFRRLWRVIKYWFWKKPVDKPEPLTAKEVVEHWTIITYKGQRIALHKHEVPMFNALSRREKRAMAMRVKAQEEKGEIKFMEIDGKMTCVRNLDYQRRADKKKAEEHGV